MHDIAALSPLPLKTDPVLAQSRPRDATLNAGKRILAVDSIVTVSTPPENFKHGLTWQVSSQDRAGVELVINARGAITSFYDKPLMSTLYGEAPSEEAQFISPNTAAARAQNYLAVAGINTKEYVLTSVHYFNGAIPASAGSQAWYIGYDRVWQDIAYLNKGVNLKLDAAQGRLMTLGAYGLAVHPPVVGRLDVSLEQAAAIARRFLTPRIAKSYGEPKITGNADVELRVVLPSHFWTGDRSDENPTTSKARLAWRVWHTVTFQSTREGVVTAWDRIMEVWIDTLTGENLGGDDRGLRGPGKISPPGGAIGRTLRTARQLQATPVAATATTADSHSSKILNSDLSKNKLRFYGVLSGIIGPSMGSQKPLASDVKFTPSYRLTATLADDKTATYLYDAATGRIATQDGLAGEVAQAGAGLRAWLAPVASLSPATQNK